jgi:ribosomal protein S18 acetylase RimI-like enzyme
MDHDPESFFVAVVDGTIAGYPAGSLGGGTVPSEDAPIERAIREHRLIRRSRMWLFFGRAMLDTALRLIKRQPRAGELDDPRWPAHLHIHAVPEARGARAGAALMRAWLDRRLVTGTPGCYLQTLVENTRAVEFFERTGFRRHGPTPVVPGIRDRGRRLHQQTMVWSA